MDTPDAPAGAARKKVLGVPVLYLAGGFVVILAAYAWKSKATPSTPPTTPAAATDPATIGGDTYPGMPVGTVIAAPGDATPAPVVIMDNAGWTREVEAYLVGTKNENPGTVQTAIQHYLAGADLSYAEGQIRDDAIRQFGLPPNIMDAGATGAAPLPVVVPPPVVVRPPTPLPVVSAAHVAHPYPTGGADLVLRWGSVSNASKEINDRLHTPGGTTFSKATMVSVENFQRIHGLPVNGVVDRRTWAELFA